jgi:hypothetical protein
MNVKKNIESIKNIPVDLDGNSMTQTDKNILSFLFPEDQTNSPPPYNNQEFIPVDQNGRPLQTVDQNGRPLQTVDVGDAGFSKVDFREAGRSAVDDSTRKYNVFLKILLLFFLFSILFLPSPLFIFDKISDNQNIHLAIKLTILFVFYLIVYKL